MIGQDTLFFTKNGFKRMEELELFDEVLTMYGTFEPIMEFGPWEIMDNVIMLSTGECIYCSSDAMWIAHNVGLQGDGCIYTDEIYRICSFSNILQPELDGDTSDDLYEFGVQIPDDIPDKYLLLNNDKKRELFAGLVDSPICETRDFRQGVYVFYTKYECVRIGIIKLARSLGWCVTVGIKNGVTIINVYVNDDVKKIPVRDEYKTFSRKSFGNYCIKILGRKEISPERKIYGRRIVVNGGIPLVGYSLVPTA